ncbi:MAG: hypothetical protein GY826_23570, partial [Fuerstiella sp.]|nr:hypothetical protein [Fuerstiella sp.]
RQQALDAFRADKAQVLVATDLAARGIDVEGITHIINFELPVEPEVYVHRIGRTGRAGATGIAISFCSPEESIRLQQIERLIGFKLLEDGRTPEPLSESEAAGDSDGSSPRSGGRNRRRRRRGGARNATPKSDVSGKTGRKNKGQGRRGRRGASTDGDTPKKPS